MADTKKKIALITGANRGLGLGAARKLAGMGYKVILAARNEAKGMEAAKALDAEGLDAVSIQLDVTDQESVDGVKSFVKDELGGLDALINNAGVFLDGKGPGSQASVFDADIEAMAKTMDVNVYGALRVAKTLVPLMRERGGGRVVNVSSGLGRLSDMGGGYPGYRASKAALNAVTRMLAAELEGTGVLVNSASPGWVRTDMGGQNATRSVEEGVDTIVWLATLPDGGPSGGFFHDREQTDW